VSKKWLTLREALKIVRRPDETDKQVLARLMAAYWSKKVRHRYNEERAAAQLDAVKAKLNEGIGLEIKTLIARHKAPSMSDAEFEEGVREGALQILLFVKFTEFDRGSLSSLTPEPDRTQLKPAKPKDILEAARAVYADPKNRKPNKDKAERLIRKWLATRGRKGDRNSIRDDLDLEEFVNQRNEVGPPKRR
jgi:hypothetical protein